MKRIQISSPAAVFFVIFSISGFSGLIYESIWSQYLKLFLGHAAYAQALVLAIFMGGMALGSALAARYSVRIQQALLGYALIEVVVGLAALGFHPFFTGVTAWAFDAVIPGLGGPVQVEVFKWLLAGGIILPQSVLLGATFPLMSAGLVRRDPQRAGYSLSMLYFSNSLGASLGVLFSGFFLVERVGLPGALLTAGVINICLALVVWLLVRGESAHLPPEALPEGKTLAPLGEQGSYRGLVLLMLGVTFVGSAASFFYEIAWIRMLSQVLGSATHSFELMLSAFILGLALGGFAIRRRLDSLAQPIRALVYIQLAMGVLAALTVPLYNLTFDWMAWGMGGLQRSDTGYTLFHWLSHGIALLVMLPATICAGMTLPLVTHVLLRSGQGERSIGMVYACNTLGAIVGVLLASLVVMPLLGMRSALMAGAFLDVLVGVALLVWLYLGARRGDVAAAPERECGAWSGRLAWPAAGVALGLLVWVQVAASFDPLRLASGVFRFGVAQLSDRQHISHQDGATASVSVFETDDLLFIATNGKVDASVGKGKFVAPDEATMAMLGAAPLFFHPGPKEAAVIGFGSGYSSHVLLGDPGLERVDTIEIEPVMVKGAEVFRPMLSRVFEDPRSNVVINDAKTYFAAHGKQYDVIIAEPSNPWVSGVSSLFSQEFYRQIPRYLKPDGVYVQWFQAYEIDRFLINTIFNALLGEFSDVQLFSVGSSDMVVVASRGQPLPALHGRPFELPQVRESLERVGIKDIEHLSMLRLAGTNTLKLLARSQGNVANSDYFPVLDQGAARTRFLGRNAMEFLRLRNTGYLLLEQLDQGLVPSASSLSASASGVNAMDGALSVATQAATLAAQPSGGIPASFQDGDSLRFWHGLSVDRTNCDLRTLFHVWLPTVHRVAQTSAYLRPGTLSPLWQRWQQNPCVRSFPMVAADWLKFYQAMDQRDLPAVLASARVLLQREVLSADEKRLLSFNGTVAALATGQREVARSLWQPYFGKHGALEIERIMLDQLMLDLAKK